MNYEHEIKSLSAETLAIQTAFAHILSRLATVDGRVADAIRLGFDDAANDAENLAIKFGKSASPDHTVKALAIIEYLRTATLGNPSKPKHAI